MSQDDELAALRERTRLLEADAAWQRRRERLVLRGGGVPRRAHAVVVAFGCWAVAGVTLAVPSDGAVQVLAGFVFGAIGLVGGALLWNLAETYAREERAWLDERAAAPRDGSAQR